MIEVKNVTKIYGKKDNQFTALEDVSFEIPEGTTVAIVGKSGSGKSTLMHAMSGLDRPTSGQIIIDGSDIMKLKSRQVDEFRSRKMSFIFQSFFVQANESCFDNVSLPLEITNFSLKDRSSRVEAALAAVELLDKKKERARNLSGGQKQRLAIARAIVNRPQILFADEPTGNLDSVTGAVIEKLLFNYNKKHDTTLIIVTHDIDLAKKCDMQIFLKDGKIESIKKSSSAKSIKSPTKSTRRKAVI